MSSNFKILVVEDDLGTQKIIKKMLDRAGYDVSISGDTEHAKTHIDNSFVDLIILDVMLPGKDGYTFCEELRQNEKTAGIPILFLTARDQIIDRVHGFSSGGDDYLTKPFLNDKLLDKVAKILKEKGTLEDV